MFSIREGETTFSPLFLHQAAWLENEDSNRPWQSGGVHCAWLFLAAGTKKEVLSLYLKENKEKKTLPVEASGVLPLQCLVLR